MPPHPERGQPPARDQKSRAEGGPDHQARFRYCERFGRFYGGPRGFFGGIPDCLALLLLFRRQPGKGALGVLQAGLQICEQLFPSARGSLMAAVFRGWRRGVFLERPFVVLPADPFDQLA